MSKERIKQLWKDPTFPGSLGGLRSFKRELLARKDIDIGDKQLREILSEIPGKAFLKLATGY